LYILSGVPRLSLDTPKNPIKCEMIVAVFMVR
jgi:hypothetical protein